MDIHSLRDVEFFLLIISLVFYRIMHITVCLGKEGLLFLYNFKSFGQFSIKLRAECLAVRNQNYPLHLTCVCTLPCNVTRDNSDEQHRVVKHWLLKLVAKFGGNILPTF